MPYKLVYIIVFVLCPLFISGQSLILNKINELKIKPGFSKVEQIIPLPNKQIAVSFVTSNFTGGGEFQHLIVLNKDTVEYLIETYYHTYEFWLAQFGDDQQSLFALNYDIISRDKQACIYTYNLTNKYLDSLNIPIEISYNNVMINQNEVVLFGRLQNNDSLLLEQAFNISKNELNQVWRAETIPKVLNWGYKQDNQSYYALSTPTYGNSNPPTSTNYLIYSSAEGYQQIEFNSSNEEHRTLNTVAFPDYNPIFPVNDSIVYVIYDARKPFQGGYNYIIASFNVKQAKVNWQYHGLEGFIFKYVKPTPNGVHVYYEGTNESTYEFINSKGNRMFRDGNSELIRYCTQKDECIVYRNDTLFLKKFGEVLAYYAFENLDQYNMLTFHPDDKHHYVSLREKGGNTMSIYQLKLDTLDTGIFNTEMVEQFSLYPNPASSMVHVELPVFQAYDLEIINLNGQVVEQLTFSGNLTTIQPTHLEEGTYWLKATGQNNQIYVSRLLWLE